MPEIAITPEKKIISSELPKLILSAKLIVMPNINPIIKAIDVLNVSFSNLLYIT